MKAKKLTKHDLLPTDAEVAKWYDECIDENIATVSSSIYKFRLFLDDYIENKLSPIKHNLNGFGYEEKRQLK